MPTDRARKRAKKTAQTPKYRLKPVPKRDIVTEPSGKRITNEARLSGEELVQREYDPQKDGPPKTKWDVVDEKIDWSSHPQRPYLANRATTLGPDFWQIYEDRRRNGEDARPPEHSPDAAIHRAFQFYSLDPSHPTHWRILIEYLAAAVFPASGGTTGKRDKTAKLNSSLIAFCKTHQCKNDSEIAKEFRKSKIAKPFAKSDGSLLSGAHIRRYIGRLRQQGLCK